MKPASKNMSASIRGQRVPGREETPISVEGLKQGPGSRIIPGESGVERPPGTRERSAARFADANGRRVGGRG